MGTYASLPSDERRWFCQCPLWDKEERIYVREGMQARIWVGRICVGWVDNNQVWKSQERIMSRSEGCVMDNVEKRMCHHEWTAPDTELLSLRHHESWNSQKEGMGCRRIGYGWKRYVGTHHEGVLRGCIERLYLHLHLPLLTLESSQTYADHW